MHGGLRRIEDIEAATQLARERIDRLLALVEPRFPVVVPNTSVAGNPWLVVGPSMLARAASTVRSISHLSALRKDADPMSLLRDQLEIVFTFAWIAVDPVARIDAWEKADMSSRLLLDDDAKRFGVELLFPSFRAELEAKVVGRPSYPSLLDRAEEADTHIGTIGSRRFRDPRRRGLFSWPLCESTSDMPAASRTRCVPIAP